MFEGDEKGTVVLRDAVLKKGGCWVLNVESEKVIEERVRGTGGGYIYMNEKGERQKGSNVEMEAKTLIRPADQTETALGRL